MLIPARQVRAAGHSLRSGQANFEILFAKQYNLRAITKAKVFAIFCVIVRKTVTPRVTRGLN